MLHSPWRLFWLTMLAGHGLIAAGWWWLMPGGFPVSHPRFWANRVAPLVVLALVVATIVAARRRRVARLRLLLLALSATWAAVAVAARLTFPISAGMIWLGPMAVAGLMAAAATRPFRDQEAPPVPAVWAVLVAAVAFGSALPPTQRAPRPDTRPLDPPIPEPPGAAADEAPGVARLGPGVMAYGGDGAALVKAGGLTLTVQPLLSFFSRSPDGCWAILARRADRLGPDLRPIVLLRGEERVECWYRCDGLDYLRVEAGEAGGPVRIDARTRLPRPVFSHLNTYCDVDISGHRRLVLVFSPCPGARIEVRRSDYPTGRPARLAYLDAGGTFRVVEAFSGEKGPFRTLGAGRLGRGEPLTITLCDEERPACRVVLEDWSAQVDTAPSPTAGWGVPVNAIEFGLAGAVPSAPAVLYVTLAGTSVGRGWDSVGHRAGTYRNRVRIEPVAPGP